MLRKPEHGIHRPAAAGLRMTRDEVVSKESALIREIRGAEVFRQHTVIPSVAEAPCVLFLHRWLAARISRVSDRLLHGARWGAAMASRSAGVITLVFFQYLGKWRGLPVTR